MSKLLTKSEIDIQFALLGRTIRADNNWEKCVLCEAGLVQDHNEGCPITKLKAHIAALVALLPDPRELCGWASPATDGRKEVDSYLAALATAHGIAKPWPVWVEEASKE